MRKSLRIAPLLLLAALPLQAQDWSFGAGIGPFVFGRFVDRKFLAGTETGTVETHTSLSATTRPGLSADFEHGVNSWLGVRLEGTFTHAPLRVRSTTSNSGVNLDAGNIDVTTLMLPLVVHLNRRGAFRFHLMGGPAYALYRIHRRTGSASLPIFSGSRGRFGAAAGAGLDWWWSDRFAVEGQITDIVTTSPFQRSDLPATTTGVHIPRPENVHTTVGLRYRF